MDLPNLLGQPYLVFMSILPNWALLLMFFLSGYTFQANDMSTALMLLNRLTAIALPIKHKRIWKKMLPFAILIIFISPLYSLRVFSLKAELLVQRDSDGDILSVTVLALAGPDSVGHF